jgi:hypothetical protein
MNRQGLGMVLSVGLVVACGLGAPGCVGASDAEGETTSEAVSALGETACETTTRDDITTVGLANCAGGYSNSADGTYDHAGCSHQYVVGYGSYSGTAQAQVFWHGPALNQPQLCQAAHLTLAAYTEANGTWSTQTTRMHGQWSSLTGCHFFYDTGYGSLDSVGSGNAHRLAASAYQVSISGTIYYPVGVRLFFNNPC